MKVSILWLINEKGEILISQRAAHMSTDAGVWGPSISGKIDKGETAEQAAVREAGEELGLDPTEFTPIHHLHDSTHNHSDGRLRTFSSFYANIESDIVNKMRLEPNEVAAVKWISFQNLQKEYAQNPETIIISSDKLLWREIFKNLKAVTK
jgi:isopentenyl-diphosphate delta-isomerase